MILSLPVKYDDIPYRDRWRVREEYIRIQEGKCHHCGEPLTGSPADKIRRLKIDASLFPRGFFRHPVHLHHSHETGMTIGAVHARCNAALWQYHGE